MLKKPLFILTVLSVMVCLTGCNEPVGSQTIVFLDGAGNYTASDDVEEGMRQAGYMGSFQTHQWSSFMLWAVDHFVLAQTEIPGEQLAEKIIDYKREFPHGRLSLMGLSAGTSVIISALEQLPRGMQVDYVVFLQSSASSRHDLRKAMEHVRYRLYNTVSPRDLILKSIPLNADGLRGSPAGLAGFRVPAGLSKLDREAYKRVINLPLRPGYAAWGWTGGHVQVTEAAFIRSVIAPRILSAEEFPLDIPVLSKRR